MSADRARAGCLCGGGLTIRLRGLDYIFNFETKGGNSMAIAKVVGMKRGSFKPEGEKEMLDYARIYVTLPFDLSPKSTEVAEGERVLDIKIPSGHLDKLLAVAKVGADVRLIFDEKGHLEDLLPVGGGK